MMPQRQEYGLLYENHSCRISQVPTHRVQRHTVDVNSAGPDFHPRIRRGSACSATLNQLLLASCILSLSPPLALRMQTAPFFLGT